MGRESTPTFITELPLKVTPKQEKSFIVRFEFAWQLYNACLGEALKRLDLMRQSKAYQSARYMPKTENFKKERNGKIRSLRREFSFQEYGLHAIVKKVGLNLGWIGASVQQTVATRAFHAANRYAFGKRFKGRGQFDSVEGEQNTVIAWNGKAVIWGGLVLPAILPKAG